MLNPTLSAIAPSPLSGSRYQARMAASAADVQAAQALRYAVFHLEMGKGMATSAALGLDVDKFDEACDHLLVHDTQTGQVVGTYRLQTGGQALAHHGYYCAQEFDFAPFEPYRAEMLELGRACIHAEHRNFSVLAALWRGIASYAKAHGSRYMVGCSSISSQDPAEAAAAFAKLQRHMAPAHLQTRPLPAFALPLPATTGAPHKLPKLLSAYLTIGSEICGPPAIDREFNTIDFLTVFDLVKIRMSGKSGWLRFERDPA